LDHAIWVEKWCLTTISYQGNFSLTI